MKLFWIIITIFAFTAAAMVWAQTRAEAGPSLMHDSANAYRAQTAADPIIASTPIRSPSNEVEVALAKPTKPQAASKDELAKELVEDLLGDERSPLDPSAQGTHAGHQESDQVARADNPWMSGQVAEEKGPVEHSIEQQSDGSTLVDGLFTLRGDGSVSSPYEITWDFLMSAAETYQPRLGMSDMPERIKMLDGKHVKISGFLMFPMATFEAKEALVMLNMWDGCCIGTMPSPYDAIEVQFTQGVPSSVRQFASYGTVSGKLLVDPYLISDWLIGLYVLEEASLNVGM